MTIRARRTVELDRAYFDRLLRPNGAERAYNEVIMVLPRPGGKLLVGSKFYYPYGLFRLPSGRIRQLESPEEAFLRETWEETGLQPAIDTKIAEIVQTCVCGADRFEARSHVFLGSQTSEPPRALDSAERVSAYREVDLRELIAIKDRLLSMFGPWQGFGRFRSFAHDVVHEYLSTRMRNESS